MLPAHERLGTDHRTRLQVELRLVHDRELVGLDRRSEVAEHRQASRGAPVDLVAVELHAGALPLGVVHGDVGASHRLDRLVVGRVDLRHTDADRHDDLEPVERHRAAAVAHAPLGQLQDLVARRAVAQDRELVAGEPGEHVVRAEHGRHPATELDEQGIARVMTERVVDLLEPVEIEHHHAPHALDPPLGDLRDVSLEQRSRREPGQGVVARLPLELLVEHPSSEADRELAGDVVEPGAVTVVELLVHEVVAGHGEHTDQFGTVVNRGHQQDRHRRPGRHAERGDLLPVGVQDLTVGRQGPPHGDIDRRLIGDRDVTGRVHTRRLAREADQDGTRGAEHLHRLVDRHVADRVDVQGAADSPGETVHGIEVS